MKNFVFTATRRGVFAFNVGCASDGSMCTPYWQGSVRGVPTATAGVDGSLWVGTDSDGVFVFPSGCGGDGGGYCPPIDHLLRAQGISAVSTGGSTVFLTHDGLTGFPATNCSAGRPCGPVFDRPNLSASGAAAVSGGTVFIRGRFGVVFALPEVCASGSSSCGARWIANVGEGLTGYGPMAVEGGVVFVGSSGSGRVYALPANCTNPCRPVWSAVAGSGVGGASVAASGGTLLVGTRDGLHAFEISGPASASASAGASRGSPVWIFYVAAVGVAALVALQWLRRSRGGRTARRGF
jgi:hypothetical protein